MITLQNSLINLLDNTGAALPGVKWVGGMGMCSVHATFGGGTVTLQYMDPKSPATWIAVGTDTTFSADGGGGFVLPAGTLIRVSIATATAVDAWVAPLILQEPA